MGENGGSLGVFAAAGRFRQLASATKRAPIVVRVSIQLVGKPRWGSAVTTWVRRSAILEGNAGCGQRSKEPPPCEPGWIPSHQCWWRELQRHVRTSGRVIPPGRNALGAVV